MSSPTLTRVVFEYDDGTRMELTGGDAARWHKSAQARLYAEIHGHPAGLRPLEKIRKVKAEGTCDRCGSPIEGFAPPSGGMTAGYYIMDGCWAKYRRGEEHVVCDVCMWADSEYRKDYPGQGTPREVSR